MNIWPLSFIVLVLASLGACSTIRCDDLPIGSRVCPCYSCESLHHDWVIHD